MTNTTHELESFLDKLRHKLIQFTPHHQEILLQSRDVLKMQVDALQFNSPIDNERAFAVGGMVRQAMNDQSSGARKDNTLGAEKTLVYGKQFQIELPAMTAKELSELSESLALLGELTQDEEMTDKKTIINLLTNDKKEDVLAFCAFAFNPDDVLIREREPTSNVAIDIVQEIIANQDQHATPAAKAMTNSTNNGDASTVRISTEKVDQLINLVGELVISHAMITQRTESLDATEHERLLSDIAQLGCNSRQLQEAAMSMRMMPVDMVFSRFPRMVRELAGKLDKQINLETKGGGIELDKALIEKIVDPLTHLIRNSIDHGIESPAIRVMNGKSPVGQLQLSATHQSGQVLISVMDDGAGLNRRRILDKAKEKGIQVSDDMADNEVWQLIFAPGFSTADVVTDVSGRGVGMDIVSRNISNLGGTITLESSAGQGTTIIVSLPLTLAILDGMSVKVGNEIYLLPISNIIESFRPRKEDIKEVSGSGAVVFSRGEYLSIVRAHKVFSIKPIHTEPAHGMLVVIEGGGRKCALFVDELIGQQQVVVKNIESNYRKITNISGATIMPDGSVAFIIDVAELLRGH